MTSLHIFPGHPLHSRACAARTGVAKSDGMEDDGCSRECEALTEVEVGSLRF